ncbi:MAG: hypothetical protein AAB697_01545 [Patescibacteria group bacterium]
MVEDDRRGEELIEATPVDVISEILRNNPQISELNFWAYRYVPLKFDESGRNPFWLIREQVLCDGALEEIEQSLGEGEQLAISSRIKLVSNEVAHLPMMDFQTPKGKLGLQLVRERFQHAGISNGWILETGKSYHYYGNNVLNQEQWLGFMGLCLLTSVVHTRDNIEQVADPRYIGHSLRRGCNTLRITTRGDKDFIPRIVARI